MSLKGIILTVSSFSGIPGSGTVALVNQSQAPIRVWQTGNAWGDRALFFEVSRPPLKARVIRGSQVFYTVNFPASITVPVGRRHQWPFDFNDGSWESEVPLSQLVGPGAEITAVYEAEETPEALAGNIWVGRLESEPYAWTSKPG